MKKRVLIYMLSVLALGLTACGDFLEEYSQNQRYAKTAQDLDELLRGECFMQAYYLSSNTQETMTPGSSGLEMNYPWLHVMDDDAEEFVVGGLPSTSNYPRNVLGSFYRWNSDLFLTLENFQYKDSDWEKFYKHIGVLNSIVYMVADFRSKGEDIDLLNKVEGEARFLRAGYYFMLVNIYGMPYAKATASRDAGVPLKVTEFIEDKYFSRQSVGAVYAQIVEDLRRAAVCLEGVVPSSSLRAGETAANAMLSRVYLYMEEYEACVKAADKALEGAYSVMDLNTWTEGQNVVSWTSPETIFTQGGNSVCVTFLKATLAWAQDGSQYSQAASFQASESLLACYDEGDLRRTAFFTSALSAAVPDKYKTWTNWNDTDKIGQDFLIRLPEVILNKAEALAMLNRGDEAKTELEKLRSKRFATAPAVSETGEALIDFIRDERRRELCFEGHRWFDLRRYAVNSIRPLAADFTIRHRNHEYVGVSRTWYESGYYELNAFAKESAAWMVPAPIYAIEFNKGELRNEVRPNRELIKN
ncbi:MAG: RagB/SusD family nutrient uptake outer membrane protein [Odoribacter sp.]|nr:RagB/SusD family nutrient uptake outer membrane protein [Odoribacter sp.]